MMNFHFSRKIALLLGMLTALSFSDAVQAQQPAGSTWDHIAQTHVLRLAGTSSELWAFRDTTGSTAPGGVKIGDTVWRGVAPVLAKALADALGAKLEIVETTWGNAVTGLQANQFDMIFGLDGTPQRAAAIGFVNQPMFLYGTALLGKTGLNLASWSAIDAAKLRIGVPVGTSQSAEIARRAPDAKLSQYQGFNEMIAALQSNRIDALATSLTSATILSARLKGSEAKLPQPAALFPATVAIRSETDPRWKNFLETSMQYFVNNGVVDQALSDVYKFRGVDVSKVDPVVHR